MKNTIALERGLILVPRSDGENTQVAATLQAELMNLGFMLDAAAFDAARHADRDWLVSYHNEIIPHLRNRLGADRAYRPFYRNFPAQVMEMSNLELFINAFVHYLSNGHWEPPQELEQRGIAFENTDFRIVRLGSEAEFKQIFTRLCSMNQSLTEADKEALKWFIDVYKDIELPEVVPFKETLCLLAAKGLDVPVKTTTDVLRIAVHLSGGDISLPRVPKVTVKEVERGIFGWFLKHQKQAQEQAREAFKFKKFSRPERRYLLGLLEKTNLDVREMQGRLGRWLRLGEILHVGEYEDRFPRVFAAFQALRNQHDAKSRIRTFPGSAFLAFQEDWRLGVDLLATRPGEFARRLDWMLRSYEPGYVLQTFSRIGAKISAKVLLELYSHFEARTQPGASRFVMLKGRRSKVKALEPLPPLDPGTVVQVKETILGIIRSAVCGLPPMGKVWIDERLRQVPIPFAMRSVNTSVRTYVRGTRIPFRAEAKVIRPFIHWYDEEGSQDLDLSAGFYDESLNQVTHISWTNLKEALLNCCHSGDIRHRQGACAEYVDVDIETCLRRGVRYAIIQVFNYNARPLHSVKDCVFGLMEREHPKANEVFVPKTISNCMGLGNESTSVTVCIIDLKDKNYIWADMESERVLATLENTASRSGQILKALIHGTRMSVYDLLKMHAIARGTLVGSASEADLPLKWEEFVTDYSKVAAYMSF